MPMIRTTLAEAGFNAENTDFDLSVAKGAIFGRESFPIELRNRCGATDNTSADFGDSKPMFGDGRTVVTATKRHRIATRQGE